MKTYYINAEMIGSEATYDDAEAVADYLVERGYNVEATENSGEINDRDNLGYIPDSVWMDALAALAEQE